MSYHPHKKSWGAKKSKSRRQQVQEQEIIHIKPEEEKLRQNEKPETISEQEKKRRKTIRDINKIKEIIIEQTRRKELKIYTYNKTRVHKKQMKFHKCKKRNRWVFGGNRSGKTECGAVEVVWMARGIHPFRENKKDTVGWVVSLSTRVQKDVAQSKILSYLDPFWIEEIVMQSGKSSSPEYGVIEKIVVKNVFGGHSVIGFKSCEEGRDKFQGSSLDYVWFDEEPTEEIYNECLMRVLDKEGDIFGTMTPLKGLTFVYDKIYLNSGADPEIWTISMEWADNPYLKKSEIKRLKGSMSEEELASRQFGLFVSHDKGRVYSEFNPSVHVIDPIEIPPEWYDKISIDPGFTNPLSAHWYAVDYDGNVYVVAEHYESGKTVEYHSQKIKEICSSLGWPRTYGGNYEALIDSASRQRTLSSPKSVAELFYEYGIAVNSNVEKDLFSGINKVKSYLKNAEGKTKLFIFSTCENMIREFKNYVWGKDETPVKRDDHSMDELRYYIMSRPKAPEEKPEKSIIQKDKERLYRKLLAKRRSLT